MIQCRFLLAGLMVLGLAPAAGAAACGQLDTPCPVPGGEYHAAPPAGWDGETPLPVTLHFHGFAQSSVHVLRNDTVRQAYSDAGVLLVAPNGIQPEGERRTWAHQGSPADGLRDETAFVAAVLDDVARRFPIDPTRIRAAGFSQGGSMVWHLACFMGDRFQAFMPVAGGFWRPHPPECPSGPVNLLHVHGTNDRVVPLAGRSVAGGIATQGDIFEGFAYWRAHNLVTGGEPARRDDGGFQCQRWVAEATGTELQLCLHPGQHSLPGGWIARSHQWAEALRR